ncbi:methionyl-tRNA formyltransferase [Alkalicoccobacillus murimartini]|uniref:Methionyl-tRNA formyltransferase n=1 Tax=Alkalicoccobacillus murimartini TaxID=171685 RepID=A0ABT9YEY2_9BACI|nr:methionyl-tRNA formyltransferase [Alkalicoccobacillus murimartini]MDQ0206408.1 methionyl-tRNA formyltransferase [Alkalicoccobacillus murimartini]
MMNIIFMGTPDFAVPVLQELHSTYPVKAVVTQPDRPVGRKKKLTPPPVKVEAERLGLPVIQPEKIRLEWETVAELKPDLIVTAAFGQILPKELLEIPQYKCLNVHASLLPKYRGGAPIHQAIIDGESETGITIMYMAEKLDAGDILSQKRVSIEDTDDVASLHDKLSQIGAPLLTETIASLIDGTVTPIKQDDSKATFARNISREMEKLDWNKGGRDLFNQIRGLCPWPVAYTTLEGQNLKIWKAELVERSSEQGKPGEIIELTDEGMVVSTGDGENIKVIELQPAGKKRMDAASFNRGVGSRLSIGMRLGEYNE